MFPFYSPLAEEYAMNMKNILTCKEYANSLGQALSPTVHVYHIAQERDPANTRANCHTYTAKPFDTALVLR